MSGDKFQAGDRIFAKMKGWPPWPAMVRERLPGKVESYMVYFYGTYDLAKIKPDCMYLYNEETKAKYGNQPRKAHFAEAMVEIEDNIRIDDPAPAAPEDSELPPANEELEETQSIEAPLSNQSYTGIDSDEGELLIDEGPPLPMVGAKKETKTPTSKRGRPGRKPKAMPVLTPKPDDLEDEEMMQPTPPAAKPGRRGSKGKRDSFSGTPDAKAESTPVTPQPEIVSRSGRKIKPKRFADEEVQFGRKSSTSSPNINDDSQLDGPPVAKRKRVSSLGSKATIANTSKADTTPIPPPPRLEKAKLLPPPTQMENAESSDSGAAGKALRPPPPLRKFDAKPKPALIPAPAPVARPAAPAPSKPPTLTRPPALVGRRSQRVSTPPSPAPPPRPTPTSEDDEVEEGEVPDSPAGVESPVSITAQEDRGIDLELEDVESDEVITPEPESPVTTEEDDMENGFDEEDESEYDVSASRKRQLSSQTGSYGNSTKKLKVDLSNGSSAILKYDHDRPRLRDISALEWDIATAKNLLRVKSQLEYNTTEFIQDIVDSVAATNEKFRAFKQAQTKEKVHKKIEQLRMEGELIEIVGELVDCLNINSADCDRAMALLDRLESHGLNSLALKKHPEVVDTVRKLQHYRGNVVYWKFNAAQTAEFNKKSSRIREKAGLIYEHLKTLFCATPDKPFHEIFHEEVEKFKESVADLSETKVLGIWAEPVKKGPKKTTKVEVVDDDHNEEDDDDESEDEDDDGEGDYEFVEIDSDAKSCDEFETNHMSPISV